MEDAAAFEKEALSIFHYQYKENEVYRQYCDLLRTDVPSVNQIGQVPFLPIQLFKTQVVQTGRFTPSLLFESSGTTGSIPSRHFIKDAAVYEQSFMAGFERFYGPVSDYCILGLLPSYLERGNSSLVYMANRLISSSGHASSGFYLYDHAKLAATISQNEKDGQRTLLIGVSYALLDFAAAYPMALQHTMVMETGGMKGRRREISREALHHSLKQQLGIAEVHSEYGMTELLSQAYSKGNGRFNCPPWMKILLRAEDDPLDTLYAPNAGKTGFISGGVKIIDLANIHSCSFIATDDTGKLFADGSFEITGRLENSDIRGCGLMLL